MRNDRIVNLLYPRRCPVCDEPVTAGEKLVCDSCKKDIRYIRQPRCRKCGKHIEDITKIFCNDCEKNKHYFDYGYALYDYQSMKSSIYRFKYQNRREYAAFYAKDIYEHLNREIERMEAQALIPVPIHSDKLRQRGYNQAELITQELSKLTGIPNCSNLIQRVRKTVPQKELDAIGRQNNLKKAFNITSDVVKLNKTIVVDDIYTTGTTIDAVTQILRQQGVRNVFFITLCIGEGI